MQPQALISVSFLNNLTYTHSFFLKICYFNWRLIMTLWWILPYTDMNQPQVYMVPYPERSSHLPPHPIPLGCPSTQALSALFHASDLHWSSVSHMVIYRFQCNSLKSSHLHLLPQNPKVCSLYLYFFSVLHIGSLLSSF